MNIVARYQKRLWSQVHQESQVQLIDKLNQGEISESMAEYMDQADNDLQKGYQNGLALGVYIN